MKILVNWLNLKHYHYKPNNHLFGKSTKFLFTEKFSSKKFATLFPYNKKQLEFTQAVLKV